MNIEKIKKILKIILIVFFVLTALAFWAENIFFVYCLYYEPMYSPFVPVDVSAYDVGFK